MRKIIPEYQQKIMLENARAKTFAQERKTIRARVKASKVKKKKSRPIKIGGRKWYF